MVKMYHTLKGNYLPYLLSFNGALALIMRLFLGLPYPTPGAVPRQLKSFYGMTGSIILPARRERTFPRQVKPRPQRYAKNKNAVHFK